MSGRLKYLAKEKNTLNINFPLEKGWGGKGKDN